MTRTQCRMARALNWSTADLARAANIGVNSVNRYETGRDARISAVEKLRSTSEAAGLAFIAENGGLARPLPHDALAPHRLLPHQSGALPRLA
jgi:transcriptional regulator with XRE-family HTH domain